jgi:tetratricopeptide (TPR) repeat protein
MTVPTLSLGGLSAQNPWPGLRAFTEGDREFFFGRERETAELLGIVKLAPVVVLYGQSGLGKTSLLQAGLFPQLKRLDFLPLRLRFDQSENAASLAQQIKQALSMELDRAMVNAPRPGADETLWEYLHRRDVDFWGPRNRLLTPVIVLDQFEEVFTLGQRSEKTAARVAEFASELESVIEHRPPDAVRDRLELSPDDALGYDFQRQSVKFILSLREDFLPQLDPWRSRMPSLLPHRFRLERMTGAQALGVVERAGRDLVEPAVAQQIVDFVSTSQRRREARSMERRDVEPGLLSVVCDELNRRRLSRGQAHITADLLTEEREGIIQSFYERSFDGVDNRVRVWVEDKLLTASGYRNRAAMEDALKLGLPASAFDLLVDRRVLHREEREGVVWLELTHDLLTDPAEQSRESRLERQAWETRQQTERAALEAARRAEQEANAKAEEARRRARRSQNTAVVALVAMVVLAAVVLFAWHEKTRAETATAKANIKTQEAESAKTAADAAASMAEQERSKAQAAAEMAEQERGRAQDAAKTAEEERSKAESSFQTAVSTSDDLGVGLMDYVRGDMKVPTATILKIIDAADRSYKRLGTAGVGGETTSTASIELRHARFLTKAAAALHQRGYFNEGRDQAQHALDLLSGLGDPSSNDRLRIARADALYARGDCLLALGDFSGARQDFNQALSLAAPAAGADLKPDTERIRVLSTIGLGQVEIGTFEFDKAEVHFKEALALADSSATNSDEKNIWKFLALEGMGLSQTDDVEADRWLEKADKTLRSSNLPEDNLRRKRLLAELEYQRGFIALRPNNYEKAEAFFKESNAASEELRKSDPDNLDARLSQVQSWRGLGMLNLDRGEWELSQETLERVEKAARELNQRQPSWMQARFVCGAAIYSQGELIRDKYYDSPPQWQDRKDFEKALQRFTEAQKWLEAGGQIPPKALQLLALIIAYQGLSYESEASDPDLSKQASAEKEKKALELYAQARATLQPIERKERSQIATFYRWTGNAQLTLDQPEAAIASYETATKILSELVKESPTPDHYYSLSYAQKALGTAYTTTKDFAKASSQYEAATKAIDKALAAHPNDLGFLEQKADIQAGIFDMRNSEGDLPRAFEAMDAAVATIWIALQSDYSNESLNKDLARYREVAKNVAGRLKTNQADANSKPGALTPQQSEALLRKIDTILGESDPTSLLRLNTQTGWILGPLVPGAWRMLSGPELEKASQRLSDADKRFPRKQTLGVRMLSVYFYDDAALYEAEVVQKNGLRGIVTYMQRGTKPPVFLNGWSDRINTMNRESPPKLDTPARATAYLRFFLSSIQSENGRFVLVDQMQDMQAPAAADATKRPTTAEEIKPLVVEQSVNGGWRGIGTIWSSGELYQAAFKLSRVGYVEILDNEIRLAAKGPSGAIEGFLDGVRAPYTVEMGVEYLRDRDDAIEKLPGFYSEHKLWKDAAAAQQKLVESTLAEKMDDKKRREKLRGEYLNFSWYQLMAREFQAALASTEAGRKLDESYLPMETNRAHALMFLGRTQEAEALYLKYRGQKISPGSDKTWNQAILEDFVALEGEGLKSPEIARVQKLLATH